MRSLKKRGPHVLDDLNDLLFSLHVSRLNGVCTAQCSVMQKNADGTTRKTIISRPSGLPLPPPSPVFGIVHVI